MFPSPTHVNLGSLRSLVVFNNNGEAGSITRVLRAPAINCFLLFFGVAMVRLSDHALLTGLAPK